MIRYYKLFDLLNRRGMKKSDLREILSPKTVSKLSKGEYLSGEAIEKICLFLGCQPGDIMEVVEVADNVDRNTRIIEIATASEEIPETSFTDVVAEIKPDYLDFTESDEEGFTTRQLIDTDNPFKR